METFWAVVSIALGIGFLALPLVLLALLWYRAGSTRQTEGMPLPQPSEVEQRVRHAIRRAGATEAQGIRVVLADGTAHLHGRVHSSYEKKLAEDVARAVPGVAAVYNEIAVAP
jgi:pseudouridine-5'-phosphate glycosidase